MARPWRIQYEDAVYHISVRGNQRREIFRDDQDREYLLSLLGRSSERFNLQALAFCLMNNHFHLFARTPDANLSRAMHWINGSYTIHYNWRHKSIGHIFQGRFKSVLVLDDSHWQRLSIYVHLNPVRAKIVEDPEDYEWSSYRDYVERNSRFAWLRRDEILNNYGRGLGRYRRYRKESLAMIGKEPGFAEQLKKGFFIGAKDKMRELASKYKPSGDGGEVTEYRAASKRSFSAQKEIARVAGVFGMKAEELQKRARNHPARAAAYCHLVERCGMSVKEVGEIFGVSGSAVSHGMARIKKTPAYSKIAGIKPAR